MKIIFYCLKGNLKFIKEYLYPLVSFLNAELIIFEKDVVLLDADYHIFIQKIPHGFSGKNIILFNIEQLSRKDFKLECSPNTIVLDYAIGNLNFIKNKKYCIPYLYNPKEIYHLPKTKDVCFIGGTSPRRHKMLNEVRKLGIPGDKIKLWGKRRDKVLFQYKILLNIGYADDYQIFEAIRCNRCIYNQMIVISDYKIDMKKIPLKEHLIFVEDKLFPQMVKFVLNHYQEVFNKLKLNEIKIDTPKIPKFLLK